MNSSGDITRWVVPSRQAVVGAAAHSYGTVLACSPGSPEALAAQARKSRKEKDPNGCGDVSGDRDERVYKVDTKKNFRLVSLKPVGREVQFQLMRLELKGL